MKVSITRGRWKSSYLRSKAEFDYSTWAEHDVSVSAYYCSVAVIIHGTWFPLESSVLNPRYDTFSIRSVPRRNVFGYWSRPACFYLCLYLSGQMLA